ncbi:putative riboflavin kinase [Phaeomoniella chlamydospora]|uniref:Riboflavin kinase n=1 Tax=Phaeomoniella chlamydospora TaxID=158046 RepID=A0A0G2G3N4_PHACM|nr:putative riboflavin kinase [Phaeomoniella chlamydospora]
MTQINSCTLLCIPTANIPPSGLSTYPDLSTGVYYGYVGLSVPSSSLANTTSDATTTSTTTRTSEPNPTTHILPSVLSIGYNPFYNNKTRSIEIHILRPFDKDFYGAPLNLLILGFIRPEYDYESLEALIEDIRTDCEVAERSLERSGYKDLVEREGEWLHGFEWVERDAEGKIKYEEGDGEVKGAEVQE